MAVDKLVDSSQLNSDLVSVANAIRAKSGGSSPLSFPAEFISEIGNIPSGGGSTLVASGTYAGTGSYPSTPGSGFAVGNKMPKTDFYVRVIARGNSEFPYDANYKLAYGVAIVFSEFGHFDLSTVADSKAMISDITFDINNSGSVTAANAGNPILYFNSVRNASAQNANMPNNFKIDRRSDGFNVRLFTSNSAYKYESGITYDWEVVYFGSNPSTDIIQI